MMASKKSKALAGLSSAIKSTMISSSSSKRKDCSSIKFEILASP
jgi:hypothetical protein